MPRVLIVEDDELVSSFIETGLRVRGFATLVVDDGELAIDVAFSGPFDLIILDLALPGEGGFEVLRRLRDEGRMVPVIVLTGRPDLSGAVQCLEVGADDYITKPFRFEELVARVNARLRPQHKESLPFEVNGVQLDVLNRRAEVAGRQVALTAREFSLLEMLMRHPDQVLSRQRIRAHVWGDDSGQESNVINVYIGALRRKLGDHVIESVRGIGYRFPSGTHRPSHRRASQATRAAQPTPRRTRFVRSRPR